MRFIFVYLCLLSLICADVKSTNGVIYFDSDSNASYEMILNTNGLGIGTIPSANLHVMGNAVITDKLAIGSGTSSSNLELHGTLGFSSLTLTASDTLSAHSFYFADTTTAGDNIWLDLPFAGNVLGRELFVKKTSSDYRVTLTSSTNIDQSTSIVLSTSASSFPYVSLISNGENWYVLDYDDASQSTSKPTSLDNLVLWLDANNGDSIVYGNTGNVSQWNDLSGNDRHATQASDSRQPDYQRYAIHGLPAFRCDSDVLFVTSGLGIGSGEDRTILLVAKPNSGYNNSEIFGTATTAIIDFGSYSVDNRVRLRDAGNDGDIYSAAGDVPYNNAHMITVTATSGNTSVYNGTTNIISSGNEHCHYDLTGSVGVCGTSYSGREFNGDVGEVIVYDRVLNSTELNQLWQYLAQKWGVSY